MRELERVEQEIALIELEIEALLRKCDRYKERKHQLQLDIIEQDIRTRKLNDNTVYRC
jgi:hypothetical protein